MRTELSTMSGKRDLQAVGKSINEMAGRINAAVIDVEVRYGDNASAVAEIDFDVFLAAASALSPRAIYLTIVPFDLEEEIDGELVEEERLKSFERKWRKREGQDVRVVASFAADGIHHILFLEAEWVSVFHSELIELGAVVERDMDAMRDAEAIEKRKRRREAMKVLLADPRFDAPKGSKAKREYLAETLFPDMTPGEIMAVVSDAESSLWLARIERGEVVLP